jgi:hydrogenase maturation protease
MTHEAASETPVLIACCGQALAGDDSLGALVAAALRAQDLPGGVELLDLGADPTRLLDHLAGRRALILVDAVSLPDHPAGTIVDCDWRAVREFVSFSRRPASSHALGLSAQLALAESLDLLPRATRVLGATLADVRLGSPPGEALLAAIPRLVARVREVAQTLATGAHGASDGA